MVLELVKELLVVKIRLRHEFSKSIIEVSKISKKLIEIRSGEKGAVSNKKAESCCPKWLDWCHVNGNHSSCRS